MGNFYHHDLFFFSNNCNSFSKRATQIKSNHGKGQIKSTQISNSKNGLFCESIQLSDSRIVDSKQIMAHLWQLQRRNRHQPIKQTKNCIDLMCKSRCITVDVAAAFELRYSSGILQRCKQLDSCLCNGIHVAMRDQSLFGIKIKYGDKQHHFLIKSQIVIVSEIKLSHLCASASFNLLFSYLSCSLALSGIVLPPLDPGLRSNTGVIYSLCKNINETYIS